MIVQSPSKASFLLICVALLVIQAGFGAYGVIFTKYGKNNHVDPLLFCLLRDGFVFPILFLASFVAEKKIMMLNKREAVVFIAIGFIGMFMNQLLYLLGITYTSADIASMFQPIVPVWTCFTAVIFRIEKIPKVNEKAGIAKIFGILLATAGAILMTYGRSSKNDKKGNDQSDKSMALGYVFLLGNTLCASILVVMQKKYIFNNPSSRWRELPIGATAWMYFFGFVSMALATLYYVDKPEKFSTITKETVMPLIYAVFVTSALCYMLITWCVMQVNTTFVTASWPLQVFFCVILAYFVLDEVLTALEIGGGLLIICAMFIIVFSNYKSDVTTGNRHVTIQDQDDHEALLSKQS